MNRRDFMLGAVALGVAGTARTGACGSGQSEVECYAVTRGGLLRVKPHVQLLDDTTLGVGWVTSRRAAGWVEWRQSGDTKWKRAWQECDGLLADAGHLVHRIEIRGYDPLRPIDYRVCSRAISVFEPYRVVYDGEAEVFYEDLDKLSNWRLAECSDAVQDGDYTLHFCVYKNDKVIDFCGGNK